MLLTSAERGYCASKGVGGIPLTPAQGGEGEGEGVVESQCIDRIVKTKSGVPRLQGTSAKAGCREASETWRHVPSRLASRHGQVEARGRAGLVSIRKHC